MPDSTVALLRDPYGFIAKRCRRLRSDVFEARLLLQPTLCMSGEEMARLFYDERYFKRHGAAPRRLVQTLFGKGGVQQLDDDAHRHRKAMFLGLMAPAGIAELVKITDVIWHARTRVWERMPGIALYDELHALLGRAVCEWAGVPLTDTDSATRVRDLVALFDNAGSVGPKHWRARKARKRVERWIARRISDVRAGRLRADEARALYRIAYHKEPDGQPMKPRVAAVELINLLRPTIAVSVYIVFVALALHQHPAWRERLAHGNDALALQFVQEVRRFYPFFPATVARVREGFEWNGLRFEKGRRAMLDLHGINHDTRIWGDPEVFRPERFEGREFGAFQFVPQGGGSLETHHRCAGEALTVGLMKLAVRHFTRYLDYELPPQDLSVDMRRLPALPRSRLMLANVRRRRS